MKIEYANESKTPFEDVAIGDVFKYNTNVYMKIDPTDENGIDLEVNALNLFTGELRHLPWHIDIEILDATLKIYN